MVIGCAVIGMLLVMLALLKPPADVHSRPEAAVAGAPGPNRRPSQDSERRGVSLSCRTQFRMVRPMTGATTAPQSRAIRSRDDGGSAREGGSLARGTGLPAHVGRHQRLPFRGRLTIEVRHLAGIRFRILSLRVNNPADLSVAVHVSQLTAYDVIRWVGLITSTVRRGFYDHIALVTFNIVIIVIR